MKSMKKILIPTDFSLFSLSGIDYALSLTKLYNAAIYMLHVVPQSVFVALYPNLDLNSETVLRDNAVKVKTEFDSFIHNYLNNVPNINQVIKQGEPYKEIVRFAHEEDMDLIVIATHGRTGLAHVLMGSVAEKVVRYSSVPVLTVKPEGLRNDILHEKDVEEQLHLPPELIN
jgi:nucleotide-binding universal stress UspA family protein